MVLGSSTPRFCKNTGRHCGDDSTAKSCQVERPEDPVAAFGSDESSGVVGETFGAHADSRSDSWRRRSRSASPAARSVLVSSPASFSQA